MKTLLVEDNEAARQLLARVLQSRGEVTACPDAESAWEAFQRDAYALVVLDWTLPGMDGLQLCKLIRALPQGDRCVILMITGRDQPEDLQLVLDAGADDYLTKPVDLQRLNIRLTIAARQIQLIAQRKQAEEALRESMERFALAAQGTSDGFWDGNASGPDIFAATNPCWYSPQLKVLLGYADHELPNVLGTWTSRLHPDDRQRVFTALTDHLERHIPYDVEYRLQTKSGPYRWFSARGQAIWDSQGRPLRMAGSIRDITEARLVREAMRAGEARYRLIAEKVTDMIWTAVLMPPDELAPGGDGIALPNVAQAGAAWNFTYVSPAVERLLEYTPDEMLALHLTDILTSASFGTALQVLQEELVQDQQHPDPMRQRTVELEHRTRSGKTVWCEVTNAFLRDAAGNAVGVVGVTRDISERKRAEDALRASEEKWRSLVENAPDTIITVDRAGSIQFINRVVAGMNLQAVLGTSCFDYVLPESRDRLREALDRVFRLGEPDSFECAGLGPHGTAAWYASRVGPIKRDGKVESVMIIATDITLRKQADEALRRDQELLKRLLDAHERERKLIAYEIHDGLVQHMTGSLMHLEAFSQAREAQPELTQSEYEQSVRLLRIAVGEGRRMISGLRPPVLDEFGVVAAIEYLVNEARQEMPAIEYVHRTNFQRLAPPLESAIFRIVQEALTNAVRHGRSPRARVELVQQDDRLRIEVRDWGRGFDVDEVHEETFGLQGIRHRARLMQGKAQIESTPGQGTRIAVEFPLLDPQ